MRLPLHVVYHDPGAPGYHCVYYMARLAAELLNAELVVLPPGNATRIQKLMTLLPRGDRGVDCLLICPSPGCLATLLQIPDWRRKYRTLVGWVFDSFWTEHIPKFARWTRVFDQVFVTEQEDLDTWRRAVHSPVDWLPWGSDVLRLGSNSPSRAFDLLRFGRQPSQWQDDSKNWHECDARGLIFQGRPPELEDATDSQLSLMNFLGSTRFALAFSNLVSPNPQTHPVREYLTGRWTDALAAGATVAGVPPRGRTISSLLWPEALLDLGTVNQGDGLQVLADAVRAWTPQQARVNYARSIQCLDWRWRFKKLAEVFGVRSERLQKELTALNAVVSSDHTLQSASQPLMF